MPDVRDLFYHGTRQQIRRVFEALGPERIDKGMSAFEDGQPNWHHCFFARAFKGEIDLSRSPDPELAVAQALGFGTNRVPVRIVYWIFDGNGFDMTRAQLAEFINALRDESRPQEILDLLRSLDTEKVGQTAIPKGAFCVA